eukprot:356814-Chlamydomonas_euryale.AAC.2
MSSNEFSGGGICFVSEWDGTYTRRPSRGCVVALCSKARMGTQVDWVSIQIEPPIWGNRPSTPLLHGPFSRGGQPHLPIHIHFTPPPSSPCWSS